MPVLRFYSSGGRGLCNSVVHNFVRTKTFLYDNGEGNLKCTLNHLDRELKIKPVLANVYLFSCEYLS